MRVLFWDADKLQYYPVLLRLSSILALVHGYDYYIFLFNFDESLNSLTRK